MDTILSSLNALVEKLGGDTTDNKLIVDALNDISAKYGGESDNKLIVDALNQIVDNYSGGGSANYVLRNITVVNRLSTNIGQFCCTKVLQDGRLQDSTMGVGAGKEYTFPLVGSSYTESTGKCVLQKFITSVKNATITSVTSEDVDGIQLYPATGGNSNFYIISIPSSPKDITITIS